VVSEKTKEVADHPRYGRHLYGRMVRMYHEGYLRLTIFRNEFERATFYDVVMSRKHGRGGDHRYIRGANLKPSDISAAVKLYQAATEYLESVNALSNEATR
jgi:hypothetical protein